MIYIMVNAHACNKFIKAESYRQLVERSKKIDEIHENCLPKQRVKAITKIQSLPIVTYRQ